MPVIVAFCGPSQFVSVGGTHGPLLDTPSSPWIGTPRMSATAPAAQAEVTQREIFAVRQVPAHPPAVAMAGSKKHDELRPRKIGLAAELVPAGQRAQASIVSLLCEVSELLASPPRMLFGMAVPASGPSQYTHETAPAGNARRQVRSEAKSPFMPLIVPLHWRNGSCSQSRAVPC